MLNENCYIVASDISRTLTTPFTVVSGQERSLLYADSYIEVVDANSDVEYDFYVEVAGMYTIRGYVSTSDGISDSFRIAIDSEPLQDWHTGVFVNFYWSTWKSVNLTTGKHKLRVAGREPGAKCSVWEIKSVEGFLVKPHREFIRSGMVTANISEVGITNGLVAYYPLNKDAKDYSGNGNHGTVTGAVLTGGGFDGKGAYKFNGYPHSITGLGQYTSLTKFTYSAWINRSVNQVNFLILGARQGNNTYISMAVIDNRVCLHKYGFNSNSDINIATGNTLINTGVWRHIVITYDEGITKTFVDGALDGSGFHINTSYSAVGMQINYEGEVSDTHKNFKGDICNVKIFNRALTAEEIAVEYKRTGVSKMTQHNGTSYIQGQVKETI